MDCGDTRNETAIGGQDNFDILLNKLTDINDNIAGIKKSIAAIEIKMQFVEFS